LLGLDFTLLGIAPNFLSLGWYWQFSN